MLNERDILEVETSVFMFNASLRMLLNESDFKEAKISFVVTGGSRLQVNILGICLLCFKGDKQGNQKFYYDDFKKLFYLKLLKVRCRTSNSRVFEMIKNKWREDPHF